VINYRGRSCAVCATGPADHEKDPGTERTFLLWLRTISTHSLSTHSLEGKCDHAEVDVHP
jgi:hypothetical protein